MPTKKKSARKSPVKSRGGQRKKQAPAIAAPIDLRVFAEELDYSRIELPPSVQTSADLSPTTDIIGQDRAIESIRLGLGIAGEGYNIFITGQSGTGRITTIKHLLERLNQEPTQLNDICYVNNFKNIDNPRVLLFPAGDGRRFRKDMGYLVSSLSSVVPKIFLSEDYKDRHSRIVREFEQRQKKLIGGFEESLTAAGFVMVQIQSGLGVRNEIQPLIDGEPSALEKLERLVKEGKFAAPQLDELRRKWDALRREFDVTSVESKKLSAKLDEAIEKLNDSMVVPLVTDKVNLLRRRYPDPRVLAYLDEVADALTREPERFREHQRQEDDQSQQRKREPFDEFTVNLIVDNAETTSTPIIIEKSPSHKNLFGALERVVDRHGYWRTDFTRISAGSLLRANGGYLVTTAMDLLTEPGAWMMLKRALRNGEVEISPFDPLYMMAGSSIKPEPVPLRVKVVLIGEPHLYRLLWSWDEDFKRIFKVKAEFDSVMPQGAESNLQYSRFIRHVVEDNKLPDFDRSALGAVTAHGRRLAGQNDKLTTRLALIGDLVRESAHQARLVHAPQVSAEHVRQAIAAIRRRVNLIEDKIQELYDRQTLMVDVTGSVVGQINGLSVYNVGEYAFGRPARITVVTSLGKAGIINIEREADLSGPIHTKGVLVLSGYLRSMFAQDKPLYLSASISFEQSYGGVDGDSASSTEIYALLSSLSGIPIRQSIAVTGSVNQLGMIQPIGGVTEKVEGFFDVCVARGLTGEQGVMIPRQNVSELLLRPDVLDAIKNGQFHVYAISTIAQGIEILTGLPAGERLPRGGFTSGSVFELVDRKLRQMALDVDRFGKEERSARSKSVNRPRKRVGR